MKARSLSIYKQLSLPAFPHHHLDTALSESWLPWHLAEEGRDHITPPDAVRDEIWLKCQLHGMRGSQSSSEWDMGANSSQTVSHRQEMKSQSQKCPILKFFHTLCFHYCAHIAQYGLHGVGKRSKFSSGSHCVSGGHCSDLCFCWVPTDLSSQCWIQEWALDGPDEGVCPFLLLSL